MILRFDLSISELVQVVNVEHSQSSRAASASASNAASASAPASRAIFRPHFEIQLLIEVAIEEAAVVVDAHQIPAHQMLDRVLVEVADEQLHVRLEFAASPQKVDKALDGHVRDAEEVVEYDPEFPPELLLC